MFSLICCYTNKLSKNQKLEILKLKNSHWRYSLREQLLHFTKNFKKNDLNNLLYYKKKLIGFTALKKQKKKVIKYLLFDTLIIHKHFRKNDLSSVLMLFNNSIIKKTNMRSFLICQKKMCKFYKKFGWKIYNKNNILFPKKKNQLVMFYN